MSRKKKKIHWGWIAGGIVGLMILAIPSEIYVSFLQDQVVKARATEQFIVTLTGTAKAGIALSLLFVGQVIYKAVKK